MSAKVFEKLAKRSRVSDALIAVISLWIIILGGALVIFAQQQLLGSAQFFAILALVTLAVFAGWPIIAGLAYLLALSQGGKADFRQILIITAFAAWPLAAIELIVIGFNFFASVLGMDPTWIVGISLLLSWIGLLIGVPGYNFAIALHAVTKIKFIQATLISLLLTFFAATIITWQYTNFLLSA